MVKVSYKFAHHGKRGKWYSQEVKTFAEAKEIREHVHKLDPNNKIVIQSRGKFVHRIPKRKPRQQSLFPSFNFNNIRI